MNKQHQQNLLTILSDKEQTPGGGIIEGAALKGVGFCYWPPVGRHEREIRELITWCTENLPQLHPSIRVETAFDNTCMTIHCRFEDIHYDRMELEADLLSNPIARIRTEAVLEEVRVKLLSLVEGMNPEPAAKKASGLKLGM